MKLDGSLTDLEMWSYWRDDRGYEHALKYQYPKLAEEDFFIKSCLIQIKAARQMIADRMAQLEADGPYDDYEFAEDLQEFWEDEE